MSLRRILAVADLNARLLARDPGPVAAYVLMPTLLMFFLAPVYRAAEHDGPAGNTQAVLGMTVMFALFTINVMGNAFYSEQSWRTWPRLRTTPVLRLELMLGKALPLFVILVLQSAALVAVGMAALGVPHRGSLLLAASVLLAYQFSVLALGICLVACAHTRGQLGVLADAGGMVFSCVGGVLVPAAAVPGWARPAMPFVPSHWAMRGAAAALDGAPARHALGAIAVLGLFGLCFLSLAGLRRRAFDRAAGA